MLNVKSRDIIHLVISNCILIIKELKKFFITSHITIFFLLCINLSAYSQNNGGAEPSVICEFISPISATATMPGEFVAERPLSNTFDNDLATFGGEIKPDAVVMGDVIYTLNPGYDNLKTVRFYSNGGSILDDGQVRLIDSFQVTSFDNTVLNSQTSVNIPTASTTAGGFTDIVQNQQLVGARQIKFTNLRDTMGDADAEALWREVSVEMCRVDTDTDGDGIFDSVDIDDDNDGVLDATECIIRQNTTAVTPENYNIVDDALLDDANDEVIITRDQQSQKGGFWFVDPISLDGDFTFVMDVYLGTNNAGADGIAMVLQPNSNMQELKIRGRGLGYRLIPDGMAFEFDTFHNPADNTQNNQDIRNVDHFSMNDTDGDSTNNEEAQILVGGVFRGLPNIEDGQYHRVVIQYFASNSRFTVDFDDVRRASIIVSDIKNKYFGGESEVFWGFTGSTGEQRNLQKAKILSVTNNFQDCNLDTDKDGIINKLDLDSDGDQCSDAFESGVVTYVESNSGVISRGTLKNKQSDGGNVGNDKAIAGNKTAENYGTNGFYTLIETNNTSDASYKGTYTYSAATDRTQKASACNSTLPVSLSLFESKQRGRVLDVRWQTESELFNIGFNVWTQLENTEGDAQWTKINPRMIPGRFDSMNKRTYRKRLRLSRAQSKQKILSVAISSVSSSGLEEVYGPYQLNKRYGFSGKGPEPIDWSEVSKQMDERMLKAGYIKHNGRYYADNRGKLKNRVKAQKLLAEFELKERGMVEISHTDLMSAGVDLTGQSVQDLSVSYQGSGIAYRAKGLKRGRWDKASSLIFYSPGLSSLGADIATLVYRLEINVSQSRQIKDIRSRGRQRSNNLSDTVIYEDVFDDQQFYALSAKGEDPWLAGYIYNNQGSIGGMNVTAGEYPWSHKVSNVMPSGKARLKMLVQNNYEDNSLTEDGIVELIVTDKDGNKQLVGEQSYKSKGMKHLEFEFSNEYLSEGETQFSLRLKGSNGANWRYSLLYIDKMSLVYDGVLKADMKSRDFRVEGSAYKALNVSDWDADDEVYGVLLKDNSVVRLLPRRGQLDVLREEFGEIRYEYVELGDYVKAHHISTLKEVEAQALSTGDADYVVIVHPMYMDQMKSEGGDFINEKHRLGHKTKLVNYYDVVNKYGYGMSSSEALSHYLRAEKENNDRLRYALLVGSACRDTRNYSGRDCIDMIPTKYVASNTAKFTPSDYSIGDIDADGYADIVVGRLPARLAEDLSHMLAKLVSQSQSELPNKVLLSAERVDAIRGHDFKAQQQDLYAGMSEEYEKLEVYGDDADFKGSQDMVSAINEGVDVWSYGGHSSVTQLGQSQSMFHYSDVAKLSPTRFPLMFPMACYMTYNVSEGTNTLSHHLMSSKVGASTIYGSSVLSSYHDNSRIQLGVIGLMSQEGLSLGEAILRTQKQLSKTSSSLIGSNIIGDPAARLR